MRLLPILTAALTAISGAVAADAQKQVIISYPESTPDRIIEQAKKHITDAGGSITHEYHLMKAFAATAAEKTFETVKTLSDEYQATVEEDQVVTIAENEA